MAKEHFVGTYQVSRAGAGAGETLGHRIQISQSSTGGLQMTCLGKGQGDPHGDFEEVEFHEPGGESSHGRITARRGGKSFTFRLGLSCWESDGEGRVTEPGTWTADDNPPGDPAEPPRRPTGD